MLIWLCTCGWVWHMCMFIPVWVCWGFVCLWIAKISVTCLPQLCSRLVFDKGSLIEPRAHPFSLTGWLMRSNDPPITYTNIHTHRQTHSTLCMSAEDPNGRYFSVWIISSASCCCFFESDLLTYSFRKHLDLEVDKASILDHFL